MAKTPTHRTRAKLEDRHRKWIVQMLACFYTPSQVHKLFRKEFPGIDITEQGVGFYDPTRLGPQRPAERWVILHTATREAYLKRQSEIGIAHSTNRLHRLDRMATKAEEQGNYALAKELIELAAKEVGGRLTNTSNLNVRDGDARDKLARFLGVSPEELPTPGAGSGPAPQPFGDPTTNGVGPDHVLPPLGHTPSGNGHQA